MKASSPPSVPCSRASPRPDRCAAFGSGSVPKPTRSRCSYTAQRDPMGRGELHRRLPGPRAIRSMPASTFTARPVARSRWMARERAGSARATAVIAMAGFHPGAPYRLHRLEDLRGQSPSRANRGQDRILARDQSGGAVREGSALLQGLPGADSAAAVGNALYRAHQLPVITALARPSSRAVAAIASPSAPYKSTRRWRQRSLPRSRPRACSDARRRRAVGSRSRGHAAAWRLAVERASYAASRAERRYSAVDPDNRLVARGLEPRGRRAWLRRSSTRPSSRAVNSSGPRALSQAERNRLLTLGPDLATAWPAPTTSPRDHKELLSSLIEEVIIRVHAKSRRPTSLCGGTAAR